jgi:hypothetical protein
VSYRYGWNRRKYRTRCRINRCRLSSTSQNYLNTTCSVEFPFVSPAIFVISYNIGIITTIYPKLRKDDIERKDRLVSSPTISKVGRRTRLSTRVGKIGEGLGTASATQGGKIGLRGKREGRDTQDRYGRNGWKLWIWRHLDYISLLSLR